MQARSFFLEHPELRVTEGAKRNALEEIENSINWLDANKRTVEEWLAARGFN